MGELIPCQILS